MSEYFATHIIQISTGLPKTYDDIVTLLDGKQPIDADLTAIAALAGTNNIYYRSAANTWTSVTIGTGLTFTAGTLASTSTATAWGAITGTLSSQTDLNTALNARQPLDADLTALAGLTSAADKLPYFTGAGTAAVTTFTAVARTLMDDATTSNMRTTLGLVIGTNVQAYNADLAAISLLVSESDTFPYYTGIGTADLATLTVAARGLLDDADSAAMRVTLGLELGVNVQAYDADLDALAAVTGTNTIYYRSAASTWTAVTIGGGLTFSAGTLNSAGGSATWGAIVGTLANQTDLDTALGGKQPLDADLTALSGLTSASNTLAYYTGAGAAALTTFTATARTLLDDSSTSAMRTTLGLAIGTDVQAYDADLAALAALSGTNNIYYRSAANTWTSVTIGGGLTFAAGTLNAAGGAATWGAIVGTLSGQTDLQAALDAKQPIDADLTAIAALAGTNNIYYRSAANTWTSVTIGSGLSFTAGTLATSGGGTGDALVANPLSQFAATTSAQLLGVMSDETGTGALVFANTPTLVTPILGTPTSGNLANCTFPTLNQSTTGSAASLTTPRTINGVSFNGTANITVTAAGSTLSDTVTVAKGGTGLTSLGTALQVLRTNGALTAMEWASAGSGDALTTGKLSQFASTTSAELLGVISDETGTGALVFADTPTLVTPVLGVATATTVNKVTITAPATSATLTIVNGGSLITAGAFSTTLTSTATTAVTLPTTGTLATLAGSEALTNKTLTAPIISTISNTGTVTLPTATDTLVGRATTDTLTNKRIDPRVDTITSSTAPTPNISAGDLFTVTALAASATFDSPSGTPVNGDRMIIRIKDNGTARTLAWHPIYRAVGVTLPTTTVISKTLYVGMIYNFTDTKWDVIATAQEA